MKIVKNLKNLLIPFVFSGFFLAPPSYSQNLTFPGNTQEEVLSKKFETNLEKRIFDENPLQNSQRDKYAVLISGNSNQKYNQNLFLAYKTFVENGFKEKNVYVLAPNGESPFPYPVDSPASKKSTKILFDYLSKKVDSEDLFFIYTTGHGDTTKIKEKINAKLIFPEQEKIFAEEFIQSLKEIKPKDGILFSDQCYGGSFAKLAKEIGYTGISASEEDKESWWNTFPQSFFRAWDKKTADKNNDGKLSLKEAFDYAKLHDFISVGELQKPQIFSKKDINKIFLKD